MTIVRYLVHLADAPVCNAGANQHRNQAEMLLLLLP